MPSQSSHESEAASHQAKEEKGKQLKGKAAHSDSDSDASPPVKKKQADGQRRFARRLCRTSFVQMCTVWYSACTQTSSFPRVLTPGAEEGDPITWTHLIEPPSPIFHTKCQNGSCGDLSGDSLLGRVGMLCLLCLVFLPPPPTRVS